MTTTDKQPSSEFHPQKRRLGQTDIEVTPIGLGGNKFSGGKGVYGMMMPDLSQEDINAIIETAMRCGINWFDSAEMYGFGRSERGITNGLKAAGVRDEDVIVATKWLPFFRTAGNLSRSIEKRRQFLEGYTIDLYMVHFPLGISSIETEMDVMADLLESGKIRAVGVSNYNAEQMRRAHASLEKRGAPLAVNQVQYSLLQRKIEVNGVLETARELGVTIVAWEPLGGGILAGKFHKDPEKFKQRPIARRMVLRRDIERSRLIVNALEEIAERYNATAAQVALNWLINTQGDMVVAIPGASKAHHAEQSAGAMKFNLSVEDMARLDEISPGSKR